MLSCSEEEAHTALDKSNYISPGAVLYYEQARRYDRRIILGLEADLVQRQLPPPRRKDKNARSVRRK